MTGITRYLIFDKHIHNTGGHQDQHSDTCG